MSTARDLRPVAALAGSEFDVLIVGAGIYGATLALHAARLGLSVALIEKGDFGEAASANSLKILHGGLRYIQKMDLPRMRQSIRARRDALRSLPYLTRAASFLAPVQERLTRSRAAYRAAGILNDLIGMDRNIGVPASHHLQGTRVLDRNALEQACGDAMGGYRGALCWQDGFMENSERFTLAYILSAREAGAVVVNYVRALQLRKKLNVACGISARDEETGATFDIRARFVVNAAGEWYGEWSGAHPRTINPARVRAYNIVVNKQWFGDYGVGLDNGDRNFFFMPWRGGTIIGTAYDVHGGTGGDARLTPDDLAVFVKNVNALFPAAALTPDDITFAHAGVLPAKFDGAGRALPLPSDSTTIREDETTHHLIVRGVKYTTASWWSAKTAAMLARRTGKNHRRTDPPPLFGSERDITAEAIQHDARAAGWTMTRESAAWLYAHYGARAQDLVARVARDPSAGRIIRGTAAPAAAVIHAMQNESALHLDDVVLRRTDLGTFARPDASTIDDLIQIMSDQAGWDDARKTAEKSRLVRAYQRVGLGLP